MIKKKILVVDDEEEIRSLVELYLQQNGYTVITAADGEEAFRELENENPDLIVLDILLPGANGLEMCHIIRAMPGFKNIPIIFLSGLQESENIISGLEVGDGYITKPFDPNVLVAKINAVFRRIQGNPEVEQQEAKHLLSELSLKEKQILRAMEKGDTNKEIAEKLKLTEGTIKVYNNVIFQKLQVTNRTQAIVLLKEINYL